MKGATFFTSPNRRLATSAPATSENRRSRHAVIGVSRGFRRSLRRTRGARTPDLIRPRLHHPELWKYRYFPLVAGCPQQPACFFDASVFRVLVPTLTRPPSASPTPADVPVLDMSDTDYYTMEAERRPHAARRSTNLNPAPARTVPTTVASVPVTETAYFSMERARRPVAAVRSGVVVKQPTPVHIAFEANKLGAAAIDTAYGAMEASRRPSAALRAGLREQDAPRHYVPVVNYRDTACAAMEAKRRPRAMARLGSHRGSATPELSHPEMRGDAAPNNLHEQLSEFARWRAGAATDELARLKIDARQPEEVNPFDSLERALAVQLEQSKSRGNSLRGATNFGRTSSSSSLTRNGSFGSSGNLQRRNTPMSPKSNLLPRPVKCVFDPSIGEVVCRREDNGDVIFHGEADDVDAKLLSKGVADQEA